MTRRIERVKKSKDNKSMSQQNRVIWLLIAILGLAFGLRVWGIAYGLPYKFHMDEIHEVVRALKLGAGEYHWGFGKGGLYYILFVVYGLLYVVWWLLGWVGNPREFATLFIQDPSALFLAGRLTVAIMGTLTILVIFLVGRRVYDWRAGLGAALIGATAYIHGVYSHIINVDIGMTLALWTSMLAYLEYEKKGDRRWLMAAGALAAISIASKLPGAIVLLPLFLAISSRSERWQNPREMFKEAGILIVITLVSLTVIAPEWTTSITSLHHGFSQILGKGQATAGPHEGDIRETMTVLRMGDLAEWEGYFNTLLRDYNFALTFTALLGVGFGLLHRRRWDIIWTVSIAVFLVSMASGDLKAAHYLLPIMPALWLLSSQAIAVVSRNRWWLRIAGLAMIVALPLVSLVRTDYEWTKPDTRVLAKEWIEANVASGAKILMDGMQYRFVQSPPLTPDNATVSRRVARAKDDSVSRGLSPWTFDLYAEAMEEVKGPRYELHSTMWGLAVEDLTYYVERCFDYIITSSAIAGKYSHGINRQRFPKSARFYEQLDNDPRFRAVYSVAPVPWQRDGPVITVYKVVPTCGSIPPK